MRTHKLLSYLLIFFHLSSNCRATHCRLAPYNDGKCIGNVWDHQVLCLLQLVRHSQRCIQIFSFRIFGITLELCRIFFSIQLYVSLPSYASLALVLNCPSIKYRPSNVYPPFLINSSKLTALVCLPVTKKNRF